MSSSLIYCSLGGKYNCLITLTRVLSPQLMSRCSTLVHYDADDITGIDDVVSKYRLQCIVLRSVHAQTSSTENIGLIIHC